MLPVFGCVEERRPAATTPLAYSRRTGRLANRDSRGNNSICQQTLDRQEQQAPPSTAFLSVKRSIARGWFHGPTPTFGQGQRDSSASGDPALCQLHIQHAYRACDGTPRVHPALCRLRESVDEKAWMDQRPAQCRVHSRRAITCTLGVSYMGRTRMEAWTRGVWGRTNLPNLSVAPTLAPAIKSCRTLEKSLFSTASSSGVRAPPTSSSMSVLNRFFRRASSSACRRPES